MTAQLEQQQSDRSRWIALYVLCAGMLMIVLDATIVNVALPSIQDDLGFSTVEPRVGRQRLPDRVRRPAAARRPARRPDRPPDASSWPASPCSRRRRCCAALAQSQELLVAARFVQGVGGAMTSAVILGMIVTMFPEPREQAKAIGVYSFVASAGGVDRPAGRRRAHAGDQLALDLLREHPDRHRHGACSRWRLLERDKGIGLGDGADIAGAVLVTSALMLGVYTIVEPARATAGAPRRTLGARRPRRSRCWPPSSPREATARNPLMPLRIFRSRNVSGANLVQVLMRGRACSGCSSSARCTCSGCSATTRSRPAWRSCRSRSLIGHAVARLLGRG